MASRLRRHRADGAADLSYVEQVAREIAPVLTPKAIVVNKSTVPVGSTRFVQRVLAGKNQQQSRRGAILAAFLKLTPVFIFLVPGMIAFALTKVPSSGFHTSGYAAYTSLVAQILPHGLRGMVACSMIVALMASLASKFNASATLFTMDFFREWYPNASGRTEVVVGRIATAVIVVMKPGASQQQLRVVAHSLQLAQHREHRPPLSEAASPLLDLRHPAIDRVVEGWGRLDVLVNAAGIASSGPTSRGPVMGIAEQDWDRILDVNLLGTVYCAQAAARHMMRQRSGRIVRDVTLRLERCPTVRLRARLEYILAKKQHNDHHHRID
jgi:hypothetical protein